MTGLPGGTGVALVTIFDDYGEADLDATGKLARDLVARGMRSVLACGTTGEAVTLTSQERTGIIEAVRAAVPDDIPVIAGTGAPSRRQAAELAGAAVAAGADAVLAWPPPGCTELARYYGTVAEAARGRPVLAYHIPWVSAPGVPVDALAALPVSGIKDSSGSPDRLLDEVANYQGATYVGSSALLALAGPLGAAGALLALANIEPERCCAAFGGDAAAQRELAGPHLQVQAGGIGGLKRILAESRGTSAATRIG